MKLQIGKVYKTVPYNSLIFFVDYETLLTGALIQDTKELPLRSIVLLLEIFKIGDVCMCQVLYGDKVGFIGINHLDMIYGP